MSTDVQHSSALSPDLDEQNRSGHLPIPRPPSAPQREPSRVNSLDVLNDLREIRELAEDLEALCISVGEAASAHRQSRGSFPAGLRNALAAVSSLRRQALERLRRAKLEEDAAGLPVLLDSLRGDYLQAKAALRVAYQQAGTLLCAGDWQSPAYAGSFPVGKNRLSEGIEEHRLDYKRDGHLDASAYEQAFVEQYGSHLGSPRLRGFLTNCGMAAYSTVLHWLTGELDTDGVVAAVEPMYFENIHLAQAFRRDVVRIGARSADELRSSLRLHRPTIVLCDAVTNCGEVMSHDVEEVLHWAAEETDRDVFVVLDTTCLPLPVLPRRLLESLPGHVSVFLVESLAKYHQFGMDAVCGGIVVAHASDHLLDSFHKTRARLGTNIADLSVGSLPRPRRKVLLRRLRRHSRNTRLLADGLAHDARVLGGAIETISWLRAGACSAWWFRGSLLSVGLREPFRSVACYREFEHAVVELARERDLPVALRTSFGFDVSRLYVTAPATPFEPPFLRISVGTETIAQVAALREVVTAASLQIAETNASRTSPNQPSTTEGGPGARSRRIHEVAPLKRSETRGAVFAGGEGLADYLCPANYAPPPLVELPRDLNPFRDRGVRLFAKMMPLVPLMNIKSLPAYSMLSAAAGRGDLEGVSKIIESSSSNTVLSLSVMARLFGIDTTCAVVDHSIAPGLLRMLRLFGIEVLLHPGPGHPMFGTVPPRSERAASFGREEGWLNPGQYSNPDNPDGFARWLGPDLWAQTQGRLGVFSCGLGTCGTMVGTARALRDRRPSVRVVACYPSPGDAVPGPRERSLLRDVSFPWQGIADECVELGARESFTASVELLRRGILGGPSSGMNYAGLLRYLGEEESAGRLGAQLGHDGELWCVFLCCDSPLAHVDEYFEVLGEDFFPTVQPVPHVEEPSAEVKEYVH